MIYISHRGNINGKNIEMENTPEYIDAAINSGYDVEIDIWVHGDRLFLGHDCGHSEIDIGFSLVFQYGMTKITFLKLE